MKKKIPFIKKIILLIGIIYINFGFAQVITDGFGTWTRQINYGNFTQSTPSGIWEVTSARINNGGISNPPINGYIELRAYNNSPNNIGGSIVTPIIEKGGAKSIEVGFYIRTIASTATIEVQKSVNGSEWQTLQQIKIRDNNTPIFTVPVNDNSDNLRFRIISVNIGATSLIDYVRVRHSYNLSVDNMEVCEGSTIILSAESSAPFTYTWSSTAGGNLNQTTGVNVTANPTQSAIYTATGTYTASYGTVTEVKTINVEVNPSPSDIMITSTVSPLDAGSCGWDYVRLDVTEVDDNDNEPVITWFPVEGLYTDSDLMVAYIEGSHATTVYAAPLVPTVYTATATLGICEKTATTDSITKEKTTFTGLDISNPTLWNIANNWSDNMVPTANKCANIPSGRLAIVNIPDAVAKTVTVASGGRLTVNTNNTLTVTDGFVNNNASNLVPIIKPQEYYVTIESDGNLIQENDEASNTGTVTVKRIARMKRQDYTYWSSPVSGQNLKTFSPNTLDNRFYTYNESNDGFVEIAPAANVFGNNSLGGFESAAKGYTIRAYNNYPTSGAVQTFTGIFTGAPNNGNITFPLKQEGAGYNLVGNPYPSNIDFDELFSNNSSVISNAAYFWTNVNPYVADGVYSANNYAQYVNGTGTPAQNDSLDKAPTNIIKPGQGFLVQAEADNVALNYNNSIRTSETDGIFFNSKGVPSSKVKDRYWLKLSTPLNNFNTIAVVYSKDAVNGFSRKDDGRLLQTGSDSFYSIPDDGDYRLAIQGREYSLLQSDVVPLGAIFYQTGTHTISLSRSEGIFADGQNIYLKDYQTGILTNLSEGSYTFKASKGESTGRFEIIYNHRRYQGKGALAVDTLQKDNLYVYKDGDDFVIRSQNKKITGLEVYDTSGRLVYKTSSNSTEIMLRSEKLNSGMYILKINRGEEVTSKKIVR